MDQLKQNKKHKNDKIHKRSSRNQIIRRILTNIVANITEYHIISKIIYHRIIIHDDKILRKITYKTI